MSSTGLWMLAALAVLVVATGLPVWALLIGVASAFAAAGLAAGVFDADVLASVGPRIVNLLEHDLLQAMPLYVFIGVLLQHTAMADALHAAARRLFGRTGAGDALAGMAVGTLVAPMNGSVAATSALLSRLVAPRLAHVPPARAVAMVSAAATIGVVVPPSLVLILLGDAMLRAHTEASNLPGYTLGTQRIVNTQDILHAALPAAAIVLVLWSIAAWRTGRAAGDAPQRVGLRTAIEAACTTAAIVVLLGGVFTGRLFAVEAAAAGGCLLAIAALVTRSLSVGAWRLVLRETLALSGALFALLVGATTFSLVFRLFGTDRWLADLVLRSPLAPASTAFLVLIVVGLCAWVLDAFEMIFVVVPVVGPLLIVQLGDAQQVSVLLLLVLQLSFLVPPLGYAVLMTRARAGLPHVQTPALLRALVPFLAIQAAVIATVFAWPAMTHLLDAPAPPQATQPTLSDEEIIQRMREMAPSDAQ